MKRWFITAGGGLLALTLILTGNNASVFAQDGAATEATEEDFNPREAYLEALATELGVTVEALEEAMTNAELQMIDRWAEEAKDRVANGEPVFPNLGGIFGGDFGGRVHIRDRAPGGMMGPAVTIVTGREWLEEGIAGLATFLGITEDDLRTDLRSGMTLIEIAEANGKTQDELRTYLIEQATERIDEQLQETADDAEATEDQPATPDTSD